MGGMLGMGGLPGGVAVVVEVEEVVAVDSRLVNLYMFFFIFDFFTVSIDFLVASMRFAVKFYVVSRGRGDDSGPIL